MHVRPKSVLSHTTPFKALHGVTQGARNLRQRSRRINITIKGRLRLNLLTDAFEAGCQTRRIGDIGVGVSAGDAVFDAQ